MRFLIVLLGLLFWLASLAGAQTAEKVWVVAVPIASVHRQPNAGSEQVTQALLWEKVQVESEQGSWAKVFITQQYRTPKGYPGWIQRKHIRQVNPAPLARTIGVAKAALRKEADPEAKAELHAFMGTRLPSGESEKAISGWEPVLLPDGRTLFVASSELAAEDQLGKVNDGREIVETASRLKGVPYVWGGMSVQGIDCSGLTYASYKAHGYTLPRDADQQFSFGKKVDPDDLKPGDLVFFGSSDDNITHVGIYMWQGKFLHASSSLGGVTVTPLDDPRFNPRYRGARRFLRQ